MARNLSRATRQKLRDQVADNNESVTVTPETEAPPQKRPAAEPEKRPEAKAPEKKAAGK